MYLTVITPLFHLLVGSNLLFVKMAILLFGSTFLFAKYVQIQPYWGEQMSKLWFTILAINLWFNIMLCFSYILESTILRGSLVITLVAVPLIIIILRMNQALNFKDQLIDFNDLRDGR